MPIKFLIKQTHKLKDINVGETFKTHESNDIYMRTNRVSSNSDLICVIDLNSGKLLDLPLITAVKIVNLEIREV